jgi:hypothetical protein
MASASSSPGVLVTTRHTCSLGTHHLQFTEALKAAGPRRHWTFLDVTGPQEAAVSRLQVGS